MPPDNDLTTAERDFANAKNPLKERYAYLHLAVSILPGLFGQDEIRQSINELGSFIDSATAGQLNARGADLEKRLDHLIADVNKQIWPRKPWQAIAAAYWQLGSDKTLLLERGMKYGLLSDWFDLETALQVPSDLPRHAQIGLARHAGTAAIEEEFLLRDSCYLLVKVEQQFQALQQLVATQKLAPIEDFSAMSGAVAHNVAAYGRATINSPLKNSS